MTPALVCSQMLSWMVSCVRSWHGVPPPSPTAARAAPGTIHSADSTPPLPFPPTLPCNQRVRAACCVLAEVSAAAAAAASAAGLAPVTGGAVPLPPPRSSAPGGAAVPARRPTGATPLPASYPSHPSSAWLAPAENHARPHPLAPPWALPPPAHAPPAPHGSAITPNANPATHPRSMSTGPHRPGAAAPAAAHLHATGFLAPQPSFSLGSSPAPTPPWMTLRDPAAFGHAGHRHPQVRGRRQGRGTAYGQSRGQHLYVV